MAYNGRMAQATATASTRLDFWEWVDQHGIPALIWGVLLGTGVVFVLLPIFALHWFQTPFLGGFIEQTMVVNMSGRADWALNRAVNALRPPGGTHFGYQVLSIDGQPVRSAQDVQHILAAHQPGEEVTLTLRAPQGTQVEVTVPLGHFPPTDQWFYFFIPYLIGLTYLLAGAWVFTLRRHDQAGRAFALFATTAGTTIASVFNVYTTHELTTLWTVLLGVVGGSLINLALVFPQRGRSIQRRPWLAWLGYFIAFPLVLKALPALYDLEHPTRYAIGWRDLYLFIGAAALFFFAWTTYRRLTTPSPLQREQYRFILWGAGLGFGPVIAWFFITAINTSLTFNTLALFPLVLFPLSIAYAILRYRLLNTDYVLSRALAYAALMVFVAGAYVALVTGLSLLIGTPIEANHPLAVGLLTLGLALGLNPLREWLQRHVDRVFFRGQTAYRERLQTFSQQLAQAMSVGEIVRVLRFHVQESLLPAQTHIYLLDSLTGQYVAAPDDSGQPTSDIRFPANSALATTLHHRQASIFLGEHEVIPKHLMADRARMALLSAQMYVPLPGQQQAIGWLALGPRRSGEPYSKDDLLFLEALCAQAAVALERAQVVADLERRAHELNVLARLAQGVNITLQFDDMLELIYAQTNQVLPTQDFRIALYDEGSDSLMYVFYLEANERLREKEHQLVRRGYGLLYEVWREGRALLSDDYERTCRERGLVPDANGLYAWIGAPLITGAEIIGVISLGSRDPSVFYTKEQRDLLQAIANQAAGAIVKARLLEETEQRAHQLAALNEVTRRMAATLEVEPLLRKILESATEILNCEAGSLLLVDEDTDELVFKVTTGPVANDLLGTRLPPGAGLVGKAVVSGECVIENNVQATREWFDRTDRQTGFITRAVLAAPMRLRDRVIGVIEVLNRRDGRPFTRDDADLLLAFAGQAAIALENARLFTLTDQALAARVEELSAMQRIDRELNASLDVERAMSITLNWAMRQMQAEAGFIGFVEKDALRVVVTQGYAEGRGPERGDLLHTDSLPWLPEVLPGDQPVLIGKAPERIAVPIRRQETTIGLLVLDATQPERVTKEALAFLDRLSDHAAIAIANAQLYDEVQRANIAKSDFVSFAAHELKNPMTSIRGYTELLLSGAVGEINEAQRNFLQVIHANVERMAALVTDLADVSRIEAGRLRLDFKAVDVHDIVDEVVSSTRHMIESKGQTLELDVPDNLPPVWGDRVRLVQILTNLVSNAHKYTEEGGRIVIHAEHTANQWDPEGAREVVHIRVEDNGIGIREEDQHKIFSKFFRADDEKTRQAPGTGLGLNITKNLVELQGGKIWFESVFRQGTTFHFTVPVAETEET